jgi:hypothetical protein
MGGGEGQRFFLAKPGGNSDFADSDWREIADFTGRKPELGREAIRSVPESRR